MGNRPDIVKLIPKNAKTILDVGCGAGLLGQNIKKIIKHKVFCYGIDTNKELACHARKYLDKVIIADLNNLSLWQQVEDKSLDVIVFADVLEHLINPLDVLKAATSKLTDNGVVITCIPNIRHWSTFYYLYVTGRWPRNERGLFDKTHLRFFTKKDIYDLHNQAGLQIEKEKRNVRVIEPWSWTNIPGILLDFWPFRSIFTFQYLHLSRLSPLKEFSNGSKF